MRFQELSDLTKVPLCFLANATDQSPQREVKGRDTSHFCYAPQLHPPLQSISPTSFVHRPKTQAQGSSARHPSAQSAPCNISVTHLQNRRDVDSVAMPNWSTPKPVSDCTRSLPPVSKFISLLRTCIQCHPIRLQRHPSNSLLSCKRPSS
jgi:hypothetical protein